MAELAILCAAAFATSVLSAIVGMAGGIILLTVMLLFYDPLDAVAIHGVVQLVSNSSRAFIQRRHVAWHLTWRYALLLLPMGYLGLQLALELPPRLTKVVIGAFVMIATWQPRWLMLGGHPEEARPELRFVVLGGCIGFMSTIVGATGPLQAPFFLNLGLSRQGIVGTKATCQALSHISKTVLFGAVGFAFLDHALAIVLMSGMVVVGTRVGSQLLDRVDERTFVILFKTALTVIAARFILWDGWKLLTGS